MLSYPPDEDPNVLEQLTTFSIAPDIHLFEIPSKYFLEEEAIESLYKENSVDNLQKY